MVDREKLGRALQLAEVDPGLISAILELHKQAQYQVNSGPYSTNISTNRGIRQGCTPAPSLWVLLSSQLLIDLAASIGEEAATPFIPFTAFADDSIGHWEVSGLESLAIIERHVTAFRELLERVQSKNEPRKVKAHPATARSIGCLK